MATNTTKLALSKPDGVDLVDVAVLNGNFDKIDAASGATVCTSTTRPATPFNGQIIFETDTLNALVYRTSTTSWNILGGSTVSENPPAGAGNGNFWWDSDNGKLYIFYNDGNSSQWVSVMPAQTAVDVTQNYLINGAFDVWQRGTSISLPANTNGFLADRWRAAGGGGGAVSLSRQSFSAGAGPAPGINSGFFLRYQQTSGGTRSGSSYEGPMIHQMVEDIASLSGRTVTFSFYAKAAANMTVQAGYNFSNFAINAFGTHNITTSWQRFTGTATLPATLPGEARFAISFPESSTFTFDVWGVQLEVGTVATAFRRNANSIEGELAACQRYYYRITGPEAYGTFGFGSAHASNQATIKINNPVTMRTSAAAVESGNLALWDGVTIVAATSVGLRSGHPNPNSTVLLVTVAGNPLPQFRPYFLLCSNNVSGFIGISSEL